MTPPPPISTLFPYTTLFRSHESRPGDYGAGPAGAQIARDQGGHRPGGLVYGMAPGDRKSTRLNSSHVAISYAVFCLKKKITRLNVRTHQRREQVAQSDCLAS